MMDNQYKLMIYFAHSTFVMYEKSIHSYPEMTVSQFRQVNEDVCQRVFDEGLSIMNYELSYEQVSRAIAVYLCSKYNPQSVKERQPHKPAILGDRAELVIYGSPGPELTYPDKNKVTMRKSGYVDLPDNPQAFTA